MIGYGVTKGLKCKNFVKYEWISRIFNIVELKKNAIWRMLKHFHSFSRI